MLEPENRRLLLDALRPPPGSKLELAIGTTYSLDLVTLLTAPLAFALFDRETDDEGRPDPVALLEALRRYADRMQIYCQAGLIAIPRDYQQVFAFIEDRVFAAVPPDRKRIFHPKIWVIRLRDPEGDALYRVLCPSRNLTFSRAWDSVTILEGRSGAKSNASRTGPLADFLRALPDLAIRDVPTEDRKAIDELADELALVEFETPDNTWDLRFWPLGIERHTKFPLKDPERLLVISPFLTRGALTGLTTDGAGHAIVSRPESLDRLGGEALKTFDKLFVLEDTAIDEDSEASTAAIDSSDEAVAERASVDLHGLHAKIYVADEGDEARVITGSANATDAAMHGNVEMLVEFRGSRRYFGVTAALKSGDSTKTTSFSDLLAPWEPTSNDPKQESIAEQLDRRLDEVQRDLAARAFAAEAKLDEQDQWILTLESKLPAEVLEGVTASVWPISVPALACEARGGQAWKAEFSPLSTQALTGFFGWELEAKEGSTRRSVRFVVDAKLNGAPADRKERILVDLLDDQSKILRYLMFLLADDGFSLADLLNQKGDGTSVVQGFFGSEQALLESLLGALVSDVSRIDHIARLILDLQAAGRGELLPTDFEAIWEPIWAAREAMSR